MGSGNNAYDRSPKGFLRTLKKDQDLLKRRIPGEVVAASGLQLPEVDEPAAIITRWSISNVDPDSWYGYARVDFFTYEAKTSGVLNMAAMEKLRSYPYAIYEPQDWEIPMNKYGLEVQIWRGDTVDQDYPGIGPEPDDFDADYLYIAPTYWGGLIDDVPVNVTAGDKFTIGLVWWDTNGSPIGAADVGGLITGLDAVIAGVTLEDKSWRSSVFPEYEPKFILTADGYRKLNPNIVGELQEGASAEGNYTVAAGRGSHAEGEGNVVIGDSSHVEGVNNQVNGWGAHAEGSNNFIESFAYYAHAEGDGHSVGGPFSHAEGSGNWTTGYGAHAEGTNTRASSGSAHSEGTATVAEGAGSHAEGLRTVAHRGHEHARGSGWASDNLLFVSRVIGAYPANVTGSGYMIRPFGLTGWGDIELNVGRASRLEIFVVGIAADESLTACWRILAMGYRPTSGNARTIGTPSVVKEFGDAGTSGWSVSLSITTAGYIRVTTNPGAVSSRWSATVHLTEVPFDDLHF